MTLSLVVHRNNDPMRWLMEIHNMFDSIHVYNCGNADLSFSYANVTLHTATCECREISFLSHIIDYYDSLSGVNIFVDDFPFKYSPDFTDLLACWREFNDFQNMGLILTNKIPIRNSHTFSNNARIHEYTIDLSPEQQRMVNLLCRCIKMPYASKVTLPHGCFAIKLRCILKHNKSLYIKMKCIILANEKMQYVAYLVWQHIFTVRVQE